MPSSVIFTTSYFIETADSGLNSRELTKLYLLLIIITKTRLCISIYLVYIK